MTKAFNLKETGEIFKNPWQNIHYPLYHKNKRKHNIIKKSGKYSFEFSVIALIK